MRFTLAEILVCPIISLVFFLSSVKKWRNPYGFAMVINSYRLVSTTMTYILSVTLICVELSIALMIWAPHLRVPAVILTILLQGLFLTAQIMRFGKVLPYGCGCFFLHGPKRVGLGTIVRNLVLLAMAVYVLHPWLVKNLG